MKHSALTQVAIVAAFLVRGTLPAFAVDDPAAAQLAAVPGASAHPAGATVGVAQSVPNNPAPVVGDLTHLVFTATGELPCTFVSPDDGAFAGGTATTLEVSTVTGAGIEVNVGGTIVPFSHIGKRTILTNGQTIYTYYGVPLEAGPNAVTITPLGARGLRGAVKRITLFGSGPATTIATTTQGKAIADGRTPIMLRVSGVDEWKHPARPGALVHITIVGGDAHFTTHHGGPAPGASASPAAAIAPERTDALAPNPFVSPPAPPPTDAGLPVQNGRAIGDLDSNTQTVDVPLGGSGEVLVPITPGLRPGDVTIRVVDGDLSADDHFFLAPYIRPPLVLGLLTVGAGSVPGIPGEDATVTNGADSRLARGALFATGAIGVNMLATLAYNTADTLDETTSNGSFVDDPANRPYQLYGDASDHRVDALSRDHLYARVDSGRSSVLWGDFTAQTGTDDGIGGFNLLVHGLEATAAGSNVKVTAFEARNDVAYARQVFSPTGLAVTSTLLHGDIIVGSDVVTLVSLDRRTGGVVSETSLSRNVDYTLDNVTGQLHFINVPLPYDADFNPQQLVITYEYGGVATNAETTGGRAEIALGAAKAVKVGIGFVNDAYGSGNYSLFTQDISGRLPGGAWSIGHATSKGNMQVATDAFDQAVGNGGDAYRLAFAMGDAVNHVSAGFEDTTAGYNNPFAGISTPGLLQYRLAYTRRLGSDNSLLTLSYDHEKNSTLGYDNADSDASLHLDQKISKRLSFKAGLDYRETRAPASIPEQGITTIGLDQPAPVVPNTLGTGSDLASQSTLQGELGVTYHPIDPLRLSVTRLTNLAGSGDLSAPEQTAADLSWEFKGNGRAYVRELWSDAAQQSFAASTASLTTGAQATRSTAFGFERSVGSNTTIDDEYVVDNGANGGDTYSALGVKERFTFGKNLKGDGFYQHANAIGSGLSGFNLYGVQLAYNVPSGLKVTTSYQIRTGDGSGATLSVGAIGALSPSLSLLGSLQDANSAGISSDDTSVGLAYRPYDDDRSVTLASFRDIGGTDTILGSKSEVASFEELYRPSWRLELAARFAYKIDGDTYYDAHSELFGLRATQRIGSRFDVGVETRHLGAGDIAGASFNSFALEDGYRIGDAMRLAVGYNFSGAPDPGLAAAPTRRGIYATATSTVDNIFGWGKSH